MNQIVTNSVGHGFVYRWGSGRRVFGLAFSGLECTDLLPAIENNFPQKSLEISGIEFWQSPRDTDLAAGRNKVELGSSAPELSTFPRGLDVVVSSLIQLFDDEISSTPSEEITDNYILATWKSEKRVPGLANCGYGSAMALQLLKDLIWRRMCWDSGDRSKR